MDTLISTKNLTKVYTVKSGRGFKKEPLPAVDHVNLEIKKGQSLGLIGESGCGKSTLGKLLLGLEKPTEGQVFFDGAEVTAMSYRQLRAMWEHAQMIFQNSTAVFDPSFTIGNSMIETQKNYQKKTKQDYREEAVRMLEKAGLEEKYMERYTSEVSGGQRQRANIARALLLHPQLVICDEPVASLDYSLRKRTLDLLNQMKEEFHLTYLFITHDLSTVKYVCDSVTVMYLGQIVERLDRVDRLEEEIAHPYSKALFASAPKLSLEEKGKRHSALSGDIMTKRDGTGCKFKERCPHRSECCEKMPKLTEISPGHLVACHKVQANHKVHTNHKIHTNVN